MLFAVQQLSLHSRHCNTSNIASICLFVTSLSLCLLLVPVCRHDLAGAAAAPAAGCDGGHRLGMGPFVRRALAAQSGSF